MPLELVRRRVVVCSSDGEFRNALNATLLRLEETVLVWPTTPEATGQALSQPIELLILSLADQGALELVERVRTHPAPHLQRLPVLGFTTNLQPTWIERCLQSGVSVLAAWPASGPAIWDRLHHALALPSVPGGAP